MIASKRLLTGIGFLLMVFFSSCSSPPAPITVYHDIYSRPGATTYILIDDSIPVGFTDSSLVATRLGLGKHFIKTEEGVKTFYVTEKGGLLNVDNSEYVIFPITYNRLDKAEPTLGMEILFPSAIAIDTFVVIQNYVKDLEDSLILKMIAGDESSVSENTIEHAMLTQRNRLRKVGKGELFLLKNWDYDMTDSIPEMISTTDRSAKTEKFMLLPERYFLTYAMNSKDVYTILNLNDVKNGLHARQIESDQVHKKIREIFKYAH